MKLKKSVLCTLLAFLSPRIVQSPPVAILGNILDVFGNAAANAADAQNAQSAAGGVNFNSSAAAAVTLTSLGNVLQVLTSGAACTVTIDTAYNICKTLPQPLSIGEQFTFKILASGATTVATPTLTGTDVTLAGTTAVLAGSLRLYLGTVTQINTTIGMPTTAGTTFTSIAQVGTTNNFTVTLGTNALVPVVGTLINLTNITGTLPAGWYPIVKVTSATSFVIATPAGTVWTATAATVGSGIVAPLTYAPLVTITGLMATATAIVTV